MIRLRTDQLCIGILYCFDRQSTIRLRTDQLCIGFLYCFDCFWTAG